MVPAMSTNTGYADSEYVTAAEACRYLRVTDRTLHRWAAAGYLDVLRLPSGQRRFRRSEVERLLEAK